MRFYRIARKHSRDPPVLREGHVKTEVVAGHARNPQQLGVQWIACDGALGRQRFAHKARRVNHLDGFLRGQPRSHQLATAGETQHQVLLNKAKRDVKIGGHETAHRCRPAFRALYRRASDAQPGLARRD